MKKITITIVTGLLMFSCSIDNENSLEDDNNVYSGQCDFQTLVSAEQYEIAPADALTINNVKIEGDCLSINFTASGCNGSTWEIKLIDLGVVFISNPGQRKLRLSLKNEELCTTSITKELSFDVSNLIAKGDDIILIITNYEDRIFYQH